MSQLPLFDLESIPRRSKRHCYTRGFFPRIVETLPLWDSWLDNDQPYRVIELSPALLIPTQRTIHPKTVAYYRNTRRQKDTNGLLPIVIHAQGRYFVVNGHNRREAFQDQPRIRVRVYEYEM